jgi:hypothetical protein
MNTQGVLELEEITVIVTYNDYIELPSDLKTIAENIKNLNITPKSKVSPASTPFIISGLVPLLTIDFLEDSKEETPLYSLGLDLKTLRFSLILVYPPFVMF